MWFCWRRPLWWHLWRFPLNVAMFPRNLRASALVTFCAVHTSADLMLNCWNRKYWLAISINVEKMDWLNKEKTHHNKQRRAKRTRQPAWVGRFLTEHPQFFPHILIHLLAIVHNAALVSTKHRQAYPNGKQSTKNRFFLRWNILILFLDAYRSLTRSLTDFHYDANFEHITMAQFNGLLFCQNEVYCIYRINIAQPDRMLCVCVLV